MRRRFGRTVAALALLVAPYARAQRASSINCDSIVAAAKADSVPVSIFIITSRVGGELQAGQSRYISRMIASAFVAPRPFRISVFSGASQMRTLRRVGSDTASELRPPTVTAVYRYVSTRDSLIGRVETLRFSMVPGFDSAATDAILAATSIQDVRSMANGDADSMRVEVRFSTDSLGDAYRLATAFFPRMPVIDAVPRRTNPAPEFPASAKADSLTSGEVVLRFVVEPGGEVAAGTVEVARASSVDFLRSALASLGAQRFAPATIRGCPVAQLVDYSFSFVLPEANARPPRDESRPRD
jgi:TonB-like protein